MRRGKLQVKKEGQQIRESFRSIHYNPSHAIFNSLACTYTTQQQAVISGIGQTTTTLLYQATNLLVHFIMRANS